MYSLDLRSIAPKTIFLWEKSFPEPILLAARSALPMMI